MSDVRGKPASGGAKPVATVPCPICKGTSFAPTATGRFSRTGKPPLCTKCHSLERHRAARILMEAIRIREQFKEYSLLLFRDEPIVAKGWFKAHENANFGKPTALDPANIARPDGAFDVVVSSHVVTHIRDHRAAVAELARIASDRGFVLLSYPSPATRDETVDWGYSDPAKHGSFRVIGRDFETEIRNLFGNAHVLSVRTKDPVTLDEDIIYLAAKQFIWPRRVLATDFDVSLLD